MGPILTHQKKAPREGLFYYFDGLLNYLKNSI